MPATTIGVPQSSNTGKELESLYIATDCAPVTQHDLRIWLAEQLEVELKDEIVEQKAIRRCSNQRLLNSGYEFLYPSYKEGYQSLIEARSK